MNTLAPSRLTDYSRLEKTIFSQGNVRALKTIVVGAGALGNEVVKALGLLGAGQITIVDPDIVDPSNLTRSVFFRGSGPIGREKAAVMAEAAGQFFPDTRFVAQPLEIADVGFGLLAGANILFSCVDSDLARLEIAAVSTKLGIPVSDGGLGAPNYSQGRVTWFSGPAGACYGCRLTSRKRRELLTLSTATVLPCFAETTAETYPSTPTMAAIVGSLQVELGLRHLFSRTEESTTVELTLDAAPRLVEFTTPQSGDCPFHNGGPPELRSLSRPDAQLQDLLTSGGRVILDWPICAGLQCLDCKHSWSPMRRAAAVRRRLVCPRCESRSILEQELIRTIEPNSRWSGFTAAALGLPENHLYTIR